MTTIAFIAASLIVFYLIVGVTGIKIEDELMYILVLIIIGILLDISYKLSSIVQKNINRK
ncbi:hypothetical protein J6TS7_57980 [Paenibacillus dendritiformis]|nr:hypothetical protein J6TS7_57980 [Paenibacillus dendritiformis]